MWNWLWKLLGIKGFESDKVLTSPVDTVKLLTAAEVAFNPPTLPSFDNIDHMEPNLYQCLAKARQEALAPVLPDELKEAVNRTVNVVLPEMFKKNLMTKTDLILIGKGDVSRDLDDEEWNTVKCFAVKNLHDNKIEADVSTSGSFISLHCEQILKVIKDITVDREESELPVMHSVGIYR